MSIIRYIFALGLGLLVTSLSAQILDSKISLSSNDVPLPDVLFQLSEQAYFDYSYNSHIITDEITLSLHVEDKELEYVLDEIEHKTGVHYKEKHDQFIFYKKRTPQKDKSIRLISGIIFDTKDGNPLSGVKITERFLGKSVFTDADGYYQMEIENPNLTLDLEIEHSDYYSKLIEVRLAEDLVFNVALSELPPLAKLQPGDDELLSSLGKMTPKETEITFVKSILLPTVDSNRFRTVKSIEDRKVVKLLVADSLLVSDESDTNLNRAPAHFGFIPGFGTNMNEGGKTINQSVSINVLAGYSAGLEGVEMGGLVNIERFNVNGVQVAGLANIIGGKMEGVQIAGITNTAKTKVNGFQIAGISNISGLKMQGFQIAGITNVHRGEMLGVQIAGINNVLTEKTVGAQISGIVNTGMDTITGLQLSGIANSLRGDIDGLQLTGISNIAENVSGMQIAGVFNYAAKLTGVQIGLINIVDSLEDGAVIGMFNIVRNGYNRIELNYNDMNMLHVRYKSGTNKFYNILSAGIITNEQSIYDIGYGVGTQMGEEKRVFLTSEVSFHVMNAPEWNSETTGADFAFLSSFETNVVVRVRKRWAITAGPALRMYIYDRSIDPAENFEFNNILIEAEGNTHNVVTYFGWNFGIQF